MDFDLETLNIREADAIMQVIQTMRCPNPLAICDLCDANKFCLFMYDMQEKCREICEPKKGV